MMVNSFMIQVFLCNNPQTKKKYCKNDGKQCNVNVHENTYGGMNDKKKQNVIKNLITNNQSLGKFLWFCL